MPKEKNQTKQRNEGNEEEEERKDPGEKKTCFNT